MLGQKLNISVIKIPLGKPPKPSVRIPGIVFPGERLTVATSHGGTGASRAGGKLLPGDISWPFAPGHIIWTWHWLKVGCPFFFSLAGAEGGLCWVSGGRRDRACGWETGMWVRAPPSGMKVIVWPQRIGAASGGFGLRSAQSLAEMLLTRSSPGLKKSMFLTNSQQILVPLAQGFYLEKPASAVALSSTVAPSCRWLFKLIKIK